MTVWIVDRHIPIDCQMGQLQKRWSQKNQDGRRRRLLKIRMEKNWPVSGAQENIPVSWIRQDVGYAYMLLEVEKKKFKSKRWINHATSLVLLESKPKP